MRRRKANGKRSKAAHPAISHFGRAVAKAAPVVAVLLVLLAAIAVFDRLGPGITGFAVVEKTFTTAISKEITAAAGEKTAVEIPVTLEAAPGSFILSGKLVGSGTAKAYLQISGQRFLILDTSQLKTEGTTTEGLLAVTGRVVEEAREQAQTITAAVTDILAADNTTNSTAMEAAAEAIDATANETAANQTTNQTAANETQQPQQNQTNETATPEPQINKTITAELRYQSRTAFDPDDNGIETEKGAVDFTVEATQFSWQQADEGKLCTRWKIDSQDTGTTAVVCNGNSSCCSLVELKPMAESWKEPLQVFYGAFNNAVGYTNSVSAQVIYADYSLETADAEVDVAYSAWQTLPATFLPILEFKSACLESCRLPRLQLNESYNATILIELESADSAATLTVESVSYTAEVVVNTAPDYKTIPTIELKKNSAATINLSQYFTDSDGDKLTFAATSDNDNVIISITRNDLAVIEPWRNFAGTATATFTASDGSAAASATAKITVTGANTAPQMLKEMENLTVAENSAATIQLSSYFYDADNDTLAYEAYKMSNITITISGETATVTPDKGFAGKRSSYFTAADKENLTAVSNVFTIEAMEGAAEKEEKTTQGKAEVGRPVKWRKTIRLTKESNTTITIPAEAEAISVREESLDLKERVMVEEKGKTSKLREHLAEKSRVGIAAKAVAAQAAEAEENITLMIEKNVTEIDVEYETPAPVATEKELGRNRKEVRISSRFHYENITAYARLATEAERGRIRLYRTTGGIAEEARIDSFTDSNGNSLIDKITWTVPSLSEQVYEVVVNEEAAQAQAALLSAYKPQQEMTMAVLEQTGIDQYISWEFTQINSTAWKADFSITEPMWSDLRQCLARPLNTCWQGFRSAYAPNSTWQELRTQLTDLANYPRQNLTDTIGFTNFTINRSTGKGSVTIQANITGKRGRLARLGWNSTVIGTSIATANGLGLPMQHSIVQTGDSAYHLFIQNGTNGGLRWLISTTYGLNWTDMGQVSGNNSRYADVRVRNSSNEFYVVYADATTGAGNGRNVSYRQFLKSGSTWQASDMQAEQTIANGTNYTYAALEIDGNRTWVAYRLYNGSAYYTEVVYSNGFSAAPVWTVSTNFSLNATTNTINSKPTFARWTGSNLSDSRIALFEFWGIDAATQANLWYWRNDTAPLTQWTAGEVVGSIINLGDFRTAAADDNNDIFYFTHTNARWHVRNETGWTSYAPITSASTNFGSPTYTSSTLYWFAVETGNGDNVTVYNSTNPYSSWNGRTKLLGNGTTISAVKTPLYAKDAIAYVWLSNYTNNQGYYDVWSDAVDVAAPRHSGNSTNSTINTTTGNDVLHSLKWNDFNLSTYIFSFDNGTGVWTNDTAVAFSSQFEAWSNTTKAINATINVTIRWQVFANDSLGRTNTSEVFSYRVVFPPFINFTTGTAANDTALNQSWVFVNVTIVEMNISNITFSLYNLSAGDADPLVNRTVTNDTTARAINFTGLALNMIYGYNVTVFNNDTLSNRTETRIIRLDNTVPTINLTNPVNNSITAAAVNYTWRATDILSAPLTCSLVINSTVNVSSIASQNSTLTNYTVMMGRGDYSWSVNCTDRALNQNTSETFMFTVDFQAPEVAITTPLNNTFDPDGNISIRFTATDRTGIANCSFYHNATGQFLLNSTNTSMEQSQNTEFSMNNLADGLSLVWAVYCADTVTPIPNEGFATANYTATVDKTSPLINNGTNSNRVRFRNVNWTFINYTYTEINNGTAFIRNGSGGTITNTTPNLNNSYFWFNFTNLSDANYTFSGWINDSASWVNETTNTSIVIDTVFPTVSYGLGTDANGSFLNRSYIHFNITTGELYGHNITAVLWSGTVAVAVLNVSANTTPGSNNVTFLSVNDGYYNISTSVSDMAGNANITATNRSVTIDTTAPAAFTLTTPANRTITANTTPTLAWAATTETNFANYTVELSNYSDFSVINYTYYALAAVSNTSIITTTALGNDTYWYWRVVAFDRALNSRTTGTFLYITDNTPPSFSTTATPNPSEFNFENVSINWTLNDLHTNYTNVNITYTNGTLIRQLSSNSTFNTSGLELGNYTLVMFAVDNATNTNTTRINITTRDTTPPSAFTLASPADNTVSNNQSPTLDWGDSADAMLANYTIQITNGSGFSFINYSFNSTASAANLTFNLTSEIKWYWRVLAFDTSGNNRISVDAFAYTPDITAPGISGEGRNPDVVYMNTSVTANATITDANLATVNIEGNWTGGLANTTVTSSTSTYSYTINSSHLTKGEVVQWRYYANDSAGNAAQGALQSFTVSNRAPNAVNLTGPINESEQLDSSVNFSWTQATDEDNDSVTYELLADDSADLATPELNITGISATSYLATVNLTKGFRYWSVRSFDSSNYSAFAGVRAIVVYQARINITLQNNTEAFPNETVVNINVSELNETDWIRNMTVSIRGTNYTPAGINSTLWQHNYTVENITAQLLEVVAYGYNSTANITARSSVTLKILKRGPGIPKIAMLCSNETYALNNTNITVKLVSMPDTLLKDVNVSVRNPANTNQALAAASNSSAGLTYYHNYTLFISATGNYTMQANITDNGNQTAQANSTFYAANRTKTVTLPASSGVNVTILDLCNAETARTGTQFTVPEDARYDVRAETAKPVVTFKSVNLTGAIATVLNYSDFGKNLTAPSGRASVAQFEFNTTLADYSGGAITYNYSAIESAVSNEDSLLVHRCANTTSCTFEQLNTSINTTAHIVTANLTNFSAFIVSEELQTQQVVTTATSSAGGGGGAARVVKENVTKYVALDIIASGSVSLYSKDIIVTPVEVVNKGNVTLRDISMSVDANTTDLEVQLSRSFIPKLEVREKENLDLSIISHTLPGRYEVTVRASVQQPKFEDSAKIFIELLERYAINRTVIVTRVQFAKDLFKENPECLELNSLLREAEKALNNSEFEKAARLTESAINGCKDLITNIRQKRIIETAKKVGKGVGIGTGVVGAGLFLLEVASHFVEHAQHFALRVLHGLGKAGKGKRKGRGRRKKSWKGEGQGEQPRT